MRTRSDHNALRRSPALLLLPLLLAAGCATHPLGTTVADPQGNLEGDPARAYLDILHADLTLDNDTYTLSIDTAAPFPAPEAMAHKRLDIIWLIDIDRLRHSGQSPLGNDYNLHLYLTKSGWATEWFKVSQVARLDDITIDKKDIKVQVDGAHAAISFPEHYLPSDSFDWWAYAGTLNAPKWRPETHNPKTTRSTFTAPSHGATAQRPEPAPAPAIDPDKPTFTASEISDAIIDQSSPATTLHNGPNQLDFVVTGPHDESYAAIIISTPDNMKIIKFPILHDFWVYAAQTHDNRYLWGITEHGWGDIGTEIRLFMSMDRGATWQHIATVPKPYYMTYFDSFHMDSNGHGEIAILYSEPAINPTLGAGYYIYETNDWGYTWSRPRYQEDILQGFRRRDLWSDRLDRWRKSTKEKLHRLQQDQVLSDCAAPSPDLTQTTPNAAQPPTPLGPAQDSSQ